MTSFSHQFHPNYKLHITFNKQERKLKLINHHFVFQINTIKERFEMINYSENGNEEEREKYEP